MTPRTIISTTKLRKRDRHSSAQAVAKYGMIGTQLVHGSTSSIPYGGRAAGSPLKQQDATKESTRTIEDVAVVRVSIMSVVQKSRK